MGLPRRPGSSLARLEDAVHAFATAERRLRGRYQKAGDILSYGRLRAMVALMARGEATPGDIAREGHLTTGTVTSMLDQLEEQGLVRRRIDDYDRRMCWVVLTDLGRSTVSERRDRWNARLADAFADVPDDDLEAAGRVLEKLAAVFEAVESDVPVGAISRRRD